MCFFSEEKCEDHFEDTQKIVDLLPSHNTEVNTPEKSSRAISPATSSSTGLCSGQRHDISSMNGTGGEFVSGAVSNKKDGSDRDGAKIYRSQMQLI